MKIFVTGASGFIGQAVVRELKGAGHSILGLARSDEGAERVRKAGGEPVRGELKDLALLASTAKACDGVAHLAFIHDFASFEASVDADRKAVTAIAEALVGSNKPFVITSGTAGGKPGVVYTEDDAPAPNPAWSRGDTEGILLAFAERGVRAMVMRLPPTVHGDGDHGFVPMLVGLAKEKGLAGYIGDGKNRWAAVHRDDAARAYRLALEKGDAGRRYHAVDEPEVETRQIAEAIGAGLGVPVRSVGAADVPAYFTWMARFYGMDAPTSSRITRERLGWAPKGPKLADDMKAHYFGK